jgi:beta-lactam-binding protein with PASTA domain
VKEGESLQKGSVIDLVLGKGLSNERAPVPFLIGKSLESARDRILVSALSLGSYIYDNTILTRNDTLNAFIYKQNPEYRDNSTIQLGSAIYLWLTVDSAKMRIDSTAVLPDTIPAADINLRIP